MFFSMDILKRILICKILLLRVWDLGEKKMMFWYILHHLKFSGIKTVIYMSHDSEGYMGISYALLILAPWHSAVGSAEMAGPFFPWGLSSSRKEVSSHGGALFQEDTSGRLLEACFGIHTSFIPHSICQGKSEASPESGVGKWTRAAKYCGLSPFIVPEISGGIFFND